VTSYVIARTLGDPTASTSARFVPLPPSPPPETAANALVPAPVAEGMPTIVVGPASPTAHVHPPAPAGAPAAPHITVDELAGVGVFSPATSAPGSPVLARKPLAFPGAGSVSESADEDTEDDAARERAGAGDGEDSEARDGEGLGGESYALLEREESWEDAGVQMRRRVPRARGAE
jgi:hypothetical protein